MLGGSTSFQVDRFIHLFLFKLCQTLGPHEAHAQGFWLPHNLRASFKNPSNGLGHGNLMAFLSVEKPLIYENRL